MKAPEYQVNIIMKALSVEFPYFKPDQRFSRNSEKFGKLQGERLQISTFLKKPTEDNLRSLLAISFYQKFSQKETFLKSYHTKLSYTRSPDNLILKSIFF